MPAQPFRLAVFDQSVSAGGVRRFTLAMLDRWLALTTPAELHLTLFWPATDTAGGALALPFDPLPPHLTVRPIPSNFKPGEGLAWLAPQSYTFDAIYFPSTVNMLRPDSDVRLGAPAIATLHDLAHEFTTAWGPLTPTVRLEMRQWTSFAQAIIFSSDYIRNEATRLYHIAPEKTHRVYLAPPLVEGAPPEAARVATLRARYNLPERFALSPGTAMIHKNPGVIVEAIGQLKREGRSLPLVLIGPLVEELTPGRRAPATSDYHRALQQRITELGLEPGRDIFLLGHIPDEELPVFYAAASLVITASRSEAGLNGPIFESMWYQRPVVCSTLPQFVERLGTDQALAYMFNPDDADDLARAIRCWLDDPVGAARRAAAAHDWVRQRTWDDPAREYLSIFRRVAEQHPRQRGDDEARVRQRLHLTTGQTVSESDLSVAVASLTALLSAPDLLAFAQTHREQITPLVLALLIVNAETAARDAQIELAETLEHLHSVLGEIAEGAADRPSAVSGAGLSAKLDAALLGFSGYAWMARQAAFALQRAGVRLNAVSIHSDPVYIQQEQPEVLAALNAAAQTAVAESVHISFFTPVAPDGAPVFHNLRARNPGHRAYVGWTMFETDRIPASWVAACNELDEVWVPSRFNVETFASAGVAREKLRVIPCGIDLAEYDPARVAPYPLPGRRGFAFLSVFEWSRRKGWDVLLDAYFGAFRSSGDVSLIIRAHGSGERSIREQIEAFARQHGYTDLPHFILLERPIPPADMPALYAAADAFVLPTRGEGWGIPCMEAMALGLPVITTDWSAHTDFVTPATGYLIRSELGDVPPDFVRDLPTASLYLGHRWANPSAAHLMELMRHVAAHPLEAAIKGRAARAFIARHFDRDVAARAIVPRLRVLLQSAPARRAAQVPAQPGKPARPAASKANGPRRARRAKANRDEALRVLFVNRPDALSLPGGDTTRMLRLKAGLEKLGAQVDVCCDLRPEPTGYDVVNVFNLLLPGIALRQACALRAGTDAPIFLTPLYWDRSESLWGEAVVPQAASAAQTSAQLDDALRQIAAGRLPAGRFTRAGRNRPYADYEADQRAVLEYVDRLIPISVAEQGQLEATLACALPSTVIPTGVDLPEAPASPEPFISQFGVRDFVLVAGRVEPRKNQLMLLLALRGAGLSIVVAGAQVHPAYLDLCRKVAPPQTFFVGRLDTDMLASARAAARVHALPSWWECAGIASLEAALADCAVVMGNRAAEPDYFGEAAYYCDPADTASIRQAVLSAYENHAADADRRAALSARIRAEYNWDAIAARTLAVYRETLAPTTRARPGQWAARQTRRDIARAYDLAFTGDPDGALRELKPHVRPASTNASALTLAGEVLVASNRPMQAVPKFQRLAELHPEDGSAFRRWGKALMAAGQLAEAEQKLRRAVQLAPDDSAARLHLGQIKMLQQQWAEARELLQSVLADHPNDATAQALLGEACHAQGNIEQARRYYEQALSLNASLHEVAQRLLSLPRAASRPLDAPPPEGTPRPAGRAATSRAGETLQLLLDADDLPAALQQQAARLDADFLDLVRLNADARRARADGNAELAPARPEIGFNVVGYASGNLGLGVIARNAIRILTDRGCPVSVADLDPALGRAGHDRSFDRLAVKSFDDLKHAINLFVLPPPTLAWLFQTFPGLLAGGRLNVALPMWELAILPPAWIEALQPLNVVVAQSHFIEHTFASHLPAALTVFAPSPLYLPDGIRPDRARFGLPDNAVVFVTGFEPHSDIQRKNPFAVIEAFRRALDNNPRAHLIIKLNNAQSNGQTHPVVNMLRQQSGDHPRIHLIAETLTYAETLNLYAACDVYVSLHRAEGLGLGPMEAMALGKPVIATAWSGNMTFMNHTNSCPVGYRLIPVAGTIPAYQKDFLGAQALWADPNVDEAAGWMARLADDADLRAAIGRKAAEDMSAFQEQARRGQFVDELLAIREQREFRQRSTARAPASPGGQPAIFQRAEARAWAADVVVPIYGQPELARRCVESALATTSDAHLLLVDDCSPDRGIAELFAEWKDHPRLTLARTPANGGFIGACRLGASLGSAPFILFLNSDTEAIEPGWLEKMIPAEADVAIVGAKLLYPPDLPGPLAGTVQHAGVARSGGGVPYHPFLGRPADTPEADAPRAVNAVTGACLLVRRQVWDELGGWDARFGKGVYEDVDLCWGARRKGYRVLYQPAARLYHRESASKAPDGRHELNAHTRDNLEKLLTKWRPLASDEDLFYGEKTARRRERARKHIQRAQAALNQRNTPSALAAMRKAVETAPDLPEALIGYAQLLSAQGDHAGAAERFERAVRLAPAAWEVRLRLVDEWIAAGAPERAAAELIALEAVFPQAAEVKQRAATLAPYLPHSAPAEEPRPESPAPRRAAQTLQLLLDADDLPAALRQHADRFDADLIALVRANADAARADGDAELAEGLDALADALRVAQPSLVHAL